jgi:IgGFc binding protein
MFMSRRGSPGALFAVALLSSLGLLMACGVDKVKFRNGNPEETAVLVVSKTEVAVLEGGEATFTVALSRDPEGPVVVSLRASNDDKLAGAPAELRFESADYDVPQTVTVTGKTDRDAANEAVSILVESAGLESVTVAVSVVECPTLAGQDFWMAFNPNYTNNGRREVYVAGAPGTAVTVGAVEAVIPANGIFYIDIGNSQIPAPGVVESGKAFRVTADAPVQVFGNNFIPFTVDAFTAVPIQLLGTDYRAIGYAGSSQSQILVYATEDNTAVTIESQPPISITLNRGQSYLRSASGDITGIRIVADKPVGVNTGDSCIFITAGACDHVEEMLFPVESWASDFFVPLIPQTQTFRVVAAVDATEVRVDGVMVATLAAGGFYTGDSGGKRVQTSKPSQAYIVAHGEPTSQGDPSFILLPGVQNGIDTATFSALSDINANTLVVSMPTAAIPSLRLDGAAVQATWTPYASGDYSHAQIGVAAGVHSLVADQPFIPVVWGERQTESYGYVAGYGYPRATCQLP